MAVKIKDIQKNSLAYKKGIKSGDTLHSINSHEICDVLDYQFYIKSEKLNVAIKTEEGKFRIFRIEKDENEDLGLEFETYLMDKQMRCSNGCVFCFIDQMPKGMRESLYFKDDDSRLSFLFGNYITLTNLSEHDINRIIEMHISPINVSVHTMNPELRVQMMKNKNAGKCLSVLQKFADAGLKLNAQLVLCPGINDGKELVFSLEKLAELYPSIQSIAAVPVGLTKHREKLCHLEEYTRETAKEVIDTVTAFGDKFKAEHGTRLAFCSDEFYIKAGLRMPDESYYEDYPQIENGVGLWKSLESEFYSALETADDVSQKQRTVSLATGVAAYPLLKALGEAVHKRFSNIRVNVYEIINDFFGHSITVAGLITAGDLINQLTGKDLGEKLIIPQVMLKSGEDIFLDDITLEEVSESLKIPIDPVSNDGYDLLDKIIL